MSHPKFLQVEVLKETTTNWGNAEFTVPCHIYVLDKITKKMIGYFMESDPDKLIMMISPKNFTKTRRSFEKVGKTRILPSQQSELEDNGLCL